MRLVILMVDKSLHIRRKKMAPSRGALLVAEPFLNEGCFRRAVVCLAEYSEEGALGFVLNAPTHFTLDELLDGVENVPAIPVFCGGPVAIESLFFLHDIATLPGAVEIAPDTGLFANGDFELLLDLLRCDTDKRHRVKFLVGYSGWSPGQLDGELRGESWAVTALSSAAECLDAVDDTFWRDTVRGMGEGYRLWLNSPQEPSLN